MLFTFSKVYACAQFLRVTAWDKIPNKKSMQSDKYESYAPPNKCGLSIKKPHLAPHKIRRDLFTFVSLLLIVFVFLSNHPIRIFHLKQG